MRIELVLAALWRAQCVELTVGCWLAKTLRLADTWILAMHRSTHLRGDGFTAGSSEGISGVIFILDGIRAIRAGKVFARNRFTSFGGQFHRYLADLLNSPPPPPTSANSFPSSNSALQKHPWCSN